MNKKDLKYEKVSEKTTHIYLKKDSSILIECPVHKCLIQFEVFYGDSLYLRPGTCSMCKEELIEQGRKEIEKNPWQRIEKWIKEKSKRVCE
jgi:hypothetical protein